MFTPSPSAPITVAVPRAPQVPPPAQLPTGLAPAARAAIAALQPAVRRVPAGRTLYEEGDEIDSVFLLAEGWAFRFRSLRDGRRQIVDFLLPGGFTGFAIGGTAAHGLEARTDCVFYVIARARLDGLIANNPALALDMVATFSRSEASALERVLALGRLNARERVAHLLLELAVRARRAGCAASDHDMTLPLTQPYIADALGLTSVHVCRTLQKMRHDGVIAFADGHLHVPDMARLRREAGFDAEQALPWGETERAAPASARAVRPAYRGHAGSGIRQFAA